MTSRPRPRGKRRNLPQCVGHSPMLFETRGSPSSAGPGMSPGDHSAALTPAHPGGRKGRYDCATGWLVGK